MSHIAPCGPVYQAGTLSGNPLAMAAGIATLNGIMADGFYESLDEKANMLSDGLVNAAKDAGIDVSLDRVGSMMGMFFNPSSVHNFEDAKKSNLDQFTAYYRGMRENGIYLAPSQFEAAFLPQSVLSRSTPS